MKTKFTIFVIAALLSVASYAQTPQFPDNTSFFNSVQSYFSSFDTNLDSTFTADKGNAWLGVATIQGAGVPIANEIGISYSIYKALQAEVVVRDSGVAGTIVSAAGGISISKVTHDTKLSFFLDGGYNTTSEITENKWFGEVGVRVMKALTPHTFAGISASYQFPGERRVFQAFTGFTF